MIKYTKKSSKKNGPISYTNRRKQIENNWVKDHSKEQKKQETNIIKAWCFSWNLQ